MGRVSAIFPRAANKAATKKPGAGATSSAPAWLRWVKVLAFLLITPVLAHLAILAGTHVPQPDVSVPDQQLKQAGDDSTRREIGSSYARKRGAINEVRLMGDMATIGHAHTSLLYEDMVAIEQHMHEQFAHFVPWAPARLLLVDMARLRFRDLEDTLSPGHRDEIAGQALAFSPDPFSSLMSKYQRFVFLHSLYDIMLSFERSPLIGCSSFVLSGERTADGHTLVGRNFDFEGPQILDDRKAVFLMLEQGRVPYASVSWPGFVGSTTGMNIEGVAIVIHGARAGEARAHGEPAAQTVRDLLGGAHSTREALAMLSGRDPMVPHMLLIADGTGEAAVVERVPGRQPHVRRRSAPTMPITNHFEGPSAEDSKNLSVMESTSTMPRRSRLDDILQNLPAGTNVQRAVDILRDKKGADGNELPLGHRSAIDALIATHSVVMDTTARTVWVSEGPHATGRYVRFDLMELLAPGYRPNGPARVEALPADDIVDDGRYDAWVADGTLHAGAQ
jgi:isopenicillin-N N-acyltransferase-like protein